MMPSWSIRLIRDVPEWSYSLLWSSLNYFWAFSIEYLILYSIIGKDCYLWLDFFFLKYSNTFSVYLFFNVKAARLPSYPYNSERTVTYPIWMLNWLVLMHLWIPLKVAIPYDFTIHYFCSIFPFWVWMSE